MKSNGVLGRWGKDWSQEGSLRRVLYLLKCRNNTSPSTKMACKKPSMQIHTHPKIPAHTLLQAIACAVHFPLL